MTPGHTIFFVGKPASGKGTQAELLSKKTGWPILSTSAGIMEVLRSGGPTAEKLKEKKDAGYLLPYWMSGYVFLKYMFSLSSDGVIFDGAARQPGENQIILDFLNWIERPFTIIYLTTSDDEIRNRTRLRRETGERADDSEDAVTKRITHYYELTDPSLELLRASGHFIEVNGEGPIEKIHEDICEELGI